MPDFQLSDVLSGRYDSYIREFAEAARNWGHSFFLRYDWEMNGNWFPWNEAVNENNPGEYVAAWRHVHDIFTAVGATNATWVWCPYAEDDRHFTNLAPLYPGDEYVDWTCMDGFNWGKTRPTPTPGRASKKSSRRPTADWSSGSRRASRWCSPRWPRPGRGGPRLSGSTTCLKN